MKVLIPEEGSAAAQDLLREAVLSDARLIAPPCAWAEVGTVLRKKVRTGHISQAEADTAWERYMSLSIDYLQDEYIPSMAWETASRFHLPTLYDAAFIAVCDRVTEERGSVEFWTADQQLLDGLGSSAPAYLRAFSTNS